MTEITNLKNKIAQENGEFWKKQYENLTEQKITSDIQQ